MGHVRTRERQSHRVIRRKLLTSVVGRIVFGGAVAVPAVTVPFAAYAQPASARTYAIPAGTLEDNLSRFGRDAGIMLSFKPEIATGKQAAASTVATPPAAASIPCSRGRASPWSSSPMAAIR